MRAYRPPIRGDQFQNVRLIDRPWRREAGMGLINSIEGRLRPPFFILACSQRTVGGLSRYSNQQGRCVGVSYFAQISDRQRPK